MNSFFKETKMHEKLHTCEESGAHLRISFQHLLMNLEKPEKSEFWKNEKKQKQKQKLLEISSFYTCVPKSKSYEVQFLRYGVRQILFAIYGHFLLFIPT